MTPDVAKRYDDLQEALSSDDYDAAERALLAVEQAYDDGAAGERRTVSRALAARDDGALDATDQQRVDDVGTRYARTEQNRAMVLMSTTLYLAAPDDADGDQLLDQLSTMQSQEESLTDALADARKLADGVTVPAHVELVDLDAPDEPVPKGAEVVVGVEVENVGDEPADDVEVSQESPLPLTPSSRSEGTLDGGEGTRVDFEGTATPTGTHVVDLTADASDVRPSTDEADVEVVDKGTALEEGRNLLAELRGTIEDRDAVAGGLERSLLKLLSAAERSVDRAMEHVEDDEADKADARIDTAIKQLGAFLNRLDAATGGGGNGNGYGNEELPGPLARTLGSLAESAIDQLALAKRADP